VFRCPVGVTAGDMSMVCSSFVVAGLATFACFYVMFRCQSVVFCCLFVVFSLCFQNVMFRCQGVVLY